MTALIFDMDDTMYLRSAPYMETFHMFFPDQVGISRSRLLERSRYYSDYEFERYKKGEISEGEMNALRVIDTLKEFGLPADLDLGMRFHELYVEKQEQIHLLPGISEILEMSAKAGVFLGMISNGSPAHQRMKYHALGLEAYILPSRLLISGDAGIHKPDPAIFSLYLQKMGLAAGDCWYIGDSYENDIIPANKTGLHTILVRWEEDPNQKNYEMAEQCFYRVEELKTFLYDLLF